MNPVIASLKTHYGDLIDEKELFPIRYQKVTYQNPVALGRSSLHASKKDRTCNPNTFYFDDRTISMEHLKFYSSEDFSDHRVMDMDSTHGSLIFSRTSTVSVLKPYDKHSISSGDIICVTLNKTKNKNQPENVDPCLKETVVPYSKIFLKFLSTHGGFFCLIKLDSSKVSRLLSNAEDIAQLFCDDFVVDTSPEWDLVDEMEENCSAPEIDVLVKVVCDEQVETSGETAVDHKVSESNFEFSSDGGSYDPELEDDSEQSQDDVNSSDPGHSSLENTESSNDESNAVEVDIPGYESDDSLIHGESSESDVESCSCIDILGSEDESTSACILLESSDDESESSVSYSCSISDSSELESLSSISSDSGDVVDLCFCDDCSYLNSIIEDSDSNKRKFEFDDSFDEGDDDEDNDEVSEEEPALKKRKTDSQSNLKKNVGLLITGITIGSVLTFAGLASLGSSMT